MGTILRLLKKSSRWQWITDKLIYEAHVAKTLDGGLTTM